jgi:hypothetical protein
MSEISKHIPSFLEGNVCFFDYSSEKSINIKDLLTILRENWAKKLIGFDNMISTQS